MRTSFWSFSEVAGCLQASSRSSGEKYALVAQGKRLQTSLESLRPALIHPRTNRPEFQSYLARCLPTPTTHPSIKKRLWRTDLGFGHCKAAATREEVSETPSALRSDRSSVLPAEPKWRISMIGSKCGMQVSRPLGTNP